MHGFRKCAGIIHRNGRPRRPGRQRAFLPRLMHIVVKIVEEIDAVMGIDGDAGDVAQHEIGGELFPGVDGVELEVIEEAHGVSWLRFAGLR